MASISKIKIGSDEREIWAVRLKTASTIKLTGSVTGSISFDGSGGDVVINTSTNHTHSYLPLSGGTLTGNPTVNKKGARYIATNGTNSVWFGINEAGTTWGIYDATNEKYLVQSDGVNIKLNGNAATATKVNKALTVKLNGGTTEGTNMFTFDGSAEKVVNITPSSIGAAASSHGTHVSYGASATAVGTTASAGTASTVSRSDHVHNLTKATVVAALGYTPPTSNTTYSAGTGLTLDGTTFKVTSANVSTMMNLLGEGTSPAQQDDYLIAQYAGGGTTTTTYHRRKVSNIITADNVKKALGTGTGTTKYLREDGTWVVPPNSNSAHSHSAGLGLTGSGSAGTSGTYTYKVNLVNETVASNAASYTAGGTSKFYAVQLDKNNKLGVYVPWTDNNTTYSVVTSTANGLVPMFDAADGTIDSSSSDWVLTNNNGSIGWYKLPANAFKNDNTNYYHTPSYTTGLKIGTGSGVSDMYVPSATGTQSGVVIMHPAANCTTFTSDDSTCTVAAVKKAVTLFTNDYAPTKTGGGASGTWGISITGNAATADKLNSSAGSSTKAIYFSGGKPVQCSDTIAHNITGYAASVSSKFSVDTSRYNQVITWYDSNGTTQHSYIGAHNTGNSTGAIIINPVKDSSKDNWSSDQGLYIGKTALKFWGSDIVTCEVVDTPPGVTTSTLYVAKSGDTMTGNLTAPKFIGALQGNADTATKANTLTTARTISLTGDVTGSVSFNGSQNVSLTATVADNSHNHSQMVNFTLGTGSTAPYIYNENGKLCARVSPDGSSYNYAWINTDGSIQATKVYGAVWNDYAEYRICNEDFIPGQVVYEIGDDTMNITTKRLQRGCSIVSDTFGFAIGETDEAKCPVAVSGRVLTYGYESREEFKKHIGWPVCSGPNGTVSIMTEEEEEKYPSRIIGTISAVPDYEEWGTEKVKVNNRIWIKIK